MTLSALGVLLLIVGLVLFLLGYSTLGVVLVVVGAIIALLHPAIFRGRA